MIISKYIRSLICGDIVRSMSDNAINRYYLISPQIHTCMDLRRYRKVDDAYDHYKQMFDNRYNKYINNYLISPQIHTCMDLRRYRKVDSTYDHYKQMFDNR